jgi:hypothetical protein
LTVSVDMVRELTIKPYEFNKELPMVNALNSGINAVKNPVLESDLLRSEKKQNTSDSSKEVSKVEKLKKSVESGEYKLDMEKTAKALLEF